MKKDDTLTIPEVARIIDKSINTVYREIKKKKLKVITLTCHGKEVTRVKKQDLERFCKDNDMSWHVNDMSNDTTRYNDDMSNDTTRYVNDMSEVIKETIDKTLTQLTKPLEEQALFIAGALTKENQFLREKLETVLEENRQLQEHIKALPGPVGEITEKLQEQEKQIQLIEELEARQRAQEEEAQKQKEYLEKKLESETEEKAKLKAAIEQERAELEVKLNRAEEEKAEIESRLKAESEEREKQIVEAWKKELELAKRPWWKKLWNFGILI